MNYYNYFTEIEEHFVRRRGKHLWITPLDWHLIETWKHAGVPLHVALRGIDIAMDHYFAQQHRSGSRLNTLAYCHEGVMAEYSRHLESHVGEDQTAGSAETGVEKAEEPERSDVAHWIRQRIFEIEALRGKQSCESALEDIGRALERLEEIARGLESNKQPDLEALERDLSLLDHFLTAALSSLIPSEELAEWAEEAKKELKIYKKRLPKETYQKIHESFVRGKIRRRFSLGELSIFHM
jgi:hypothetical protein